MELILLSSDTEGLFWNIVEQDYFDYYFFISDWALQKSHTQIYFAIEHDNVVGLMLIYNDYIVQLRGNESAVRFLLDNLTLHKADVQAPACFGSLLTEKYPRFLLKENIILMSLKKGQEVFMVTMMPQLLSVADAPAVAELMHLCYPEMWSEVTANNVEDLMNCKDAVWLGIKIDGNLAAFGHAMKTPKVSHVTWVATNPQYQRRGYATSIVSSLIKECLVSSESTIIYVVENNLTAKNIYMKAGFKPSKSYVFIKT